MKLLTNKYLEKDFKIGNGMFYNIVIENPNLYYSFINNLVRQIDYSADGYWILSSDETIINLSKSSIVLKDFFDISNIDKRISSLLVKRIAKEIQRSDLSYSFSELNTQICMFMKKISESIDISIEYNDEIDISSLLKVVDTKASIDSNNFLEMFVSWVRVLIELLNIEVIWTVDIKSFLTREDLILVQKELEFLNVTLINYESRKKYDIIDFEDTTIIDNDLCEIHQ